jgi:hypothetical protein
MFGYNHEILGGGESSENGHITHIIGVAPKAPPMLLTLNCSLLFAYSISIDGDFSQSTPTLTF